MNERAIQNTISCYLTRRTPSDITQKKGQIHCKAIESEGNCNECMEGNRPVRTKNRKGKNSTGSFLL